MPLFDKKDKSRYATFTRRSVGMGASMTAVFAVLGGRLYQLQIRDGDQYKVEAEDNRVSERLIAPPRAAIRTELNGVDQLSEPTPRRIRRDDFENRVARRGLLAVAAQDHPLNIAELERGLVLHSTLLT